METDLEYLLSKIHGFCAYQERCIHDVTEKLNKWKVSQKHIGKIIAQLIKEDYLNEERYARNFAGGKFRINHWGKTKIIHELKRSKVPEPIIQVGLEEIDDNEYMETLKDILQRKNREIREKDPWKKKQKLIAFGAQKGYDYSSIKQVLNDIEM